MPRSGITGSCGNPIVSVRGAPRTILVFPMALPSYIRTPHPPRSRLQCPRRGDLSGHEAAARGSDVHFPGDVGSEHLLGGQLAICVSSWEKHFKSFARFLIQCLFSLLSRGVTCPALLSFRIRGLQAFSPTLQAALRS